MTENEKAIVDIVNERIVGERSPVKPETLVKAHYGINLIVAKDLVKLNVEEMESTMEFSENGKRYKLSYQMRVEDLDK